MVNLKLAAVALAFNPSTGEAETGGSRPACFIEPLPGWSGIYREILCQKAKATTKNKTKH